MKKDFFNGNIKREFVSHIWTTIIIVAVIFFGCGGLFLYLSFFGNLDNATSLFLLVFGVALCLFGIWYSFGTIWVIRKYPKYRKITKWFLNSECYFVDGDSKEFHGHWRGRVAFDIVTQVAEQNKGLADIKYPKKYRRYIVLAIIGIVLMFVYIAVTYIALENIGSFPQAFQNEGIIFGVLAIVEVTNIILSFIFAFQVKKIREETIKEYREKQCMNNTNENK